MTTALTRYDASLHARCRARGRSVKRELILLVPLQHSLGHLILVEIAELDEHLSQPDRSTRLVLLCLPAEGLLELDRCYQSLLYQVVT